jgi:hypothetical protein
VHFRLCVSVVGRGMFWELEHPHPIFSLLAICVAPKSTVK